MSEELLDDSNALGMMRAEHRQIKELIASCLDIDQIAFQQQALVPLLQELEVHERLEHQFFYPFASEYVPENLVQRSVPFEDDVEALTERLRTMSPEDPAYRDTLSELMQRFDRHCYEEEQYVFLNMEGKDPDFHNKLVILADRMKMTREEMLAEMRRPRRLDAAGDRAVTTQEVQQRVAQEEGRHIYPGRDVILDTDRAADGEDVVATTSGDLVSEGRRSFELNRDDADLMETDRLAPDPLVGQSLESEPMFMSSDQMLMSSEQEADMAESEGIEEPVAGLTNPDEIEEAEANLTESDEALRADEEDPIRSAETARGEANIAGDVTASQDLAQDRMDAGLEDERLRHRLEDDDRL